MADRPSSAHHDKQPIQVEEREAGPAYLDDLQARSTGHFRQRGHGVVTPVSDMLIMRPKPVRQHVIPSNSQCNSCMAVRAILTALRLVPAKGQLPADADVMG